MDRESELNAPLIFRDERPEAEDTSARRSLLREEEGDWVEYQISEV
ncbi:hypothetical protein PC116_g17226 [Phytophthora cactorum]|uniref:Uncharacterized protein n=1 Tax=Phytophthora cactorum TaxID=29920 RepID=A0A8T1CQM7_9STRA|nr:hypothetical protein Pcac1_g12723 [Phytophthora cactorum]KAG2895408.1 hypothetical protein PC114_g15489 [Phytophthora cactorum]KAG2926154.1 hypothetical protein PC117_g14968 [Phytophthora cactorum]KAG3152861.1 hypothetical protein C6341_g16133 [Phytophthora cactorum]KAG3178966.1 hypothetical protein PC128_g16134 [Phytophthora cactorum]